MKKEQLIKLAQQLKQPDSKAAYEFSQKKDEYASHLNELMLKRDDLTKLIGIDGQTMMQDNHRNHVRFMESIFLAYDPEVLVDTVLWVFRAYRSHGFNLAYWPAFIGTCINQIKKEFTEETYNQIYPFYNWLLVNQAAFVELSDKEMIN